jgi:hypothetical protein
MKDDCNPQAIGYLTNNDPGPDIIQIRMIDETQPCFWNIPLNTRLVYPSGHNLCNYDEKPLIPDSPIVTAVHSKQSGANVLLNSRSGSCK